MEVEDKRMQKKGEERKKRSKDGNLGRASTRLQSKQPALTLSTGGQFVNVLKGCMGPVKGVVRRRRSRGILFLKEEISREGHEFLKWNSAVSNSYSE